MILSTFPHLPYQCICPKPPCLIACLGGNPALFSNDTSHWLWYWSTLTAHVDNLLLSMVIRIFSCAQSSQTPVHNPICDALHQVLRKITLITGNLFGTNQCSPNAPTAPPADVAITHNGLNAKFHSTLPEITTAPSK